MTQVKLCSIGLWMATLLPALFVGQAALGYPCTRDNHICPPASGSAPAEWWAKDACVANSLNNCTLEEVADYEAFCRLSGERCTPYTVFSGTMTQNGPEFIAEGSAVIGCF